MRSEGKEGKAQQWRNALLFPPAAWDHVELFGLRGKAEGRAW